MSGPKKMGRPPKELEEESAQRVLAMSKYGVPQEDIAIMLGMCVETLQKLYGRELQEGRISANAAVGETLFTKAIKGDTAAAIFWAKTRMRWRETHDVEISGKGGGPIQVADLASMSDEQLKTIVAGPNRDDE